MIKRLLIPIIVLFASFSLAEEWHWQRNDDLLNPSGIKTMGMNTPSTDDFDGDGDIDLIVGCKGGVLQYYENIGTPDSAIWLMDEDYFDGAVLDTTLAPKPQLVDLDGDNTRELYLGFTDNYWGEPSGILLKFINIGSIDNPLWQSADFDIGYDISGLGFPQFIDYDYDGDYDLILHGLNSDFRYFENIGDAHNPSFANNNFIFEHFSPSGSYLNCNLANLCGDNKYELVIVKGEYDGTRDESLVELYINIGTMDHPIWRRADEILITASYLTNICFADMDNDQDMDMLVGNHRPPLFYNENYGTSDSVSFNRTFNGERLGPIYVSRGDNIHFVDFDNDSDLDFIGFYYYISWPDGDAFLGCASSVNTGNAVVPEFNFNHSFVRILFCYYRSMAISSGDFNADGFKELVFNYDPVSYVSYDSGTGYDFNAFYDLGLGEMSFTESPELADLNNDGLLDIMVRQIHGGNWKCYQNTGTPTQPVWQDNPAWIAGIDSNILVYRAAELNGDGKIDLVGVDGTFHLRGFINVGSAGNASFVYDSLVMADLRDYSPYYIDCADLDGDGKDDIVIDSAGVIIFIKNMSTLGIDDSGDNLPANFGLKQNYPNPFNLSTTIDYTIPKTGEVTLEIYDILGRGVLKLAEGIQPAGNHRLTWDATDFASGIYFYRLQAGDFQDIRKMILIK